MAKDLPPPDLPEELQQYVSEQELHEMFAILCNQYVTLIKQQQAIINNLLSIIDSSDKEKT